MVKVLILGGTKFLGRDFLENVNKKHFEIHVASRRDPGTRPYYEIDRKKEADLAEVISLNNFDIIIDFISYSMPDARKLINAIHAKRRYRPYLITISSTYVYGNPLHLEESKEYDESSFTPSDYAFSTLDRPDIDYFQGKRSMESYIAKNYDNYALIRFPVILGANDYTGKTTFFSERITNKKRFSFDDGYGASNFMFSQEAAQVLRHIVTNRHAGSLNCCLNERLNQFDIFSMYCDFFKVSKNEILDNNATIVKSPFYYRKDFIINNSKQRQLFDLKITFEEALQRELQKIFK